MSTALGRITHTPGFPPLGPSPSHLIWVIADSVAGSVIQRSPCSTRSRHSTPKLASDVRAVERLALCGSHLDFPFVGIALEFCSGTL